MKYYQQSIRNFGLIINVIEIYEVDVLYGKSLPLEACFYCTVENVFYSLSLMEGFVILKAYYYRLWESRNYTWGRGGYGIFDRAW